MGLAIGSDRDLAHVPPAATLFLHRKIGGMYLMAAKLRARVALGWIEPAPEVVEEEIEAELSEEDIVFGQPSPTGA